MNRFRYDSDVQIRFPDLATAVVTITDVDNTIDPPDLTTEIATQTDAVRRRLAEQPVAEMPSITAWRRVFTSFGTKPTRYRNAAEALLRRIGGQNDLPALNPLTDLANLVSADSTERAFDDLMRRGTHPQWLRQTAVRVLSCRRRGAQRVLDLLDDFERRDTQPG